MSAWRHLPNAQHIDRVIASVNQHPDIWGESHDAAGGRGMVRSAAWSVTRGEARGEVWDVAWCEAYDAARSAARDAARSAAFEAAYDAILALFAYDDCEQYLNMTGEELKVWSYLSEHPAAILLLPAVTAFERIKELEEC